MEKELEVHMKSMLIERRADLKSSNSYLKECLSLPSFRVKVRYFRTFYLKTEVVGRYV